MAIDATDFGDVSMLRDEPVPGGLTYEKVGGYCVVGVATSALTPGDAVIIDTGSDGSYKTTTSANQTTAAGCVVAGLRTAGQQWDYVSTIANGSKILVRIVGVAKMTASAAITRGDRVSTSTTAGRIATSTTAGAILGKALQSATAAGDQILVLLASS